MSSLVLLIVLLSVLFFSFYGKKTFLGYWGSLFLMLFSSVLLFPVIGFFGFLPGAMIVLILGSLKN